MGKLEKLEWTPVKVKLGELLPWDRNPVTITKKEADKLIESTDELSQMLTLAIGPRGENGIRDIYDGNQRHKIWSDHYGEDFEVWALQSNRKLTEKERRKVPIVLRTATGHLDFDLVSGEYSEGELVDLGIDQEFVFNLGRQYGAAKSIISVAKLDDAFSAINALIDIEDDTKDALGDTIFFNVTIPCTKEQRQSLIEEMNRRKKELGFETNLQVILNSLGLENG